jgi:excisionase family DNA binding protein
MHAYAEHSSSADGSEPTEGERLAYSVRNAAKVIDVSERTMWELIKSGEIASFKVRYNRRILRADLQKYLNNKLAPENRGAA